MQETVPAGSGFPGPCSLLAACPGGPACWWSSLSRRITFGGTDAFLLAVGMDTICSQGDTVSTKASLLVLFVRFAPAFEMMGLGNGRRSMKSPPLVLAALVACIIVLGFNYWIASSRSVDLQVPGLSGCMSVSPCFRWLGGRVPGPWCLPLPKASRSATCALCVSRLGLPTSPTPPRPTLHIHSALG